MVVPTEKQDARNSYKKVKGYHSNIAFVGRIPVHIENPNDIFHPNELYSIKKLNLDNSKSISFLIKDYL